MTEEQSQEDKHLQNGEPITLVRNQKNNLNIAKADYSLIQKWKFNLESSEISNSLSILYAVSTWPQKKLSRTCKWGSIDLGGGNADRGDGGKKWGCRWEQKW